MTHQNEIKSDTGSPLISSADRECWREEKQASNQPRPAEKNAGRPPSTEGEKECICCKEIKPVSEFYPHKQMGDGRLNKCKTCCKKHAREREIEIRTSDPIRLERLLQQSRESQKRATQSGRAKKYDSSKSKKEWRDRNREKRDAHIVVGNSIRSGQLIQLPCYCGGSGEAHHEDYSKPLDVEWLCSHHHAQRHMLIRRNARIAKFNIQP